jgi:hypothetical protein
VIKMIADWRCKRQGEGVQKGRMAYAVTQKEKKARRRAQFAIACKGVSKDEFADLRRALTEQFGCRVTLRNPVVPQFDANTVHHIIAHVTDNVIGGYAVKKVIDAAEELFVAYIKFKFLTSPDAGKSRRVVVSAPSGEVYRFKDKGKRSKKNK